MEKDGIGGITRGAKVPGTEGAGVIAACAGGAVTMTPLPHRPRTPAASSTATRAQRSQSATEGAALFSEVRMAFVSAITLKQRRAMIGSTPNSVNAARNLL